MWAVFSEYPVQPPTTPEAMNLYPYVLNAPLCGPQDNKKHVIYRRLDRTRKIINHPSFDNPEFLNTVVTTTAGCFSVGFQNVKVPAGETYAAPLVIVSAIFRYYNSVAPPRFDFTMESRALIPTPGDEQIFYQSYAGNTTCTTHAGFIQTEYENPGSLGARTHSCCLDGDTSIVSPGV